MYVQVLDAILKQFCLDQPELQVKQALAFYRISIAIRVRRKYLTDSFQLSARPASARYGPVF